MCQLGPLAFNHRPHFIRDVVDVLDIEHLFMEASQIGRHHDLAANYAGLIDAGLFGHSKNSTRSAITINATPQASVKAPTRSKGGSWPPAIVDDPRPLAQGDDRFRPSLHGSSVGCFRNLEILDAGKVLNDVLAGIVPHIEPVREIGSGFHFATSSLAS